MHVGREGGREKTVLALFFVFVARVYYTGYISPGSPGW